MSLLYETTKNGTGQGLSVSQAISAAKAALNGIYLSITAEVCEVSDKPGYKAVYFSLRDPEASLPCLIWKSEYARCPIQLSSGMLVEAYGFFDIYQQKGRMQFQVKSLKAAGEGVLRQKVDILAKKLASEGLMDASRKKPVPNMAMDIAIVTSPRGKAVHDCLRTLRRRFPLAAIKFFGVPVEGADAAFRIREGLCAAIAAKPDVILLVRGGGSYEDLMPFNDELLARCIASSNIPIVTGIGHEPDNSIADMVADRRCSTPTAAAESIVPESSEIYQYLDYCNTSMDSSIGRKISDRKARLARYESMSFFKQPESIFQRDFHTLETYALRIDNAIPASLSRADALLSNLSTRLQSKCKRDLLVWNNELSRKAASLEGLSPLAVLSRGYAMTRRASDNSIVTGADSLIAGDKLILQLRDGKAECTVDTIERNTRNERR